MRYLRLHNKNINFKNVMNMKKNLLLIPVAALAFAACTNEKTEYVGDTPIQPKEIAFSPIAQKATRGANAILDTTFPTDNTMEVACYQSAPATASNYFTKCTFSKGTTYWAASPKKYWPLSAATLNFFAVSGFGVQAEDITIANDLSTATVKYNADAANNNSSTAYSDATQSDIMYAFNRGSVVQTGNNLTFNGGTDEAGSTVSMVFKHALSLIDFQIKAADAETESALTINSITLTGAKYTGTLTITNTNAATVSEVWSAAVSWVGNDATNRTVPNVPTTANYDAGTEADYLPASPSTACLMIIPDATSAFTSFTINYTFNGHTYDYTYTPASTVAVAGYKYTFRINFRLHEITINPSVTLWDAPHNTDIDLF